jgi:phosphopantothenoylcysteine decarboxylase/phosphopantothenate--cysteine ligase
MNGRRLLIGVSGGIAAYKTAAIVSQLAQSGANVSVILTASAKEFIGEATFAALTGNPVATKLFDPRFPLGAHIELAQSAELLCIAPATAGTLSSMALGSCDDLLSTTYTCFSGAVLAAPAMNKQMWEHPAVQRNVDQLRADGVHIIDPEKGWLSCREAGVGRMADPERIVESIKDALHKS